MSSSFNLPTIISYRRYKEFKYFSRSGDNDDLNIFFVHYDKLRKDIEEISACQLQILDLLSVCNIPDNKVQQILDFPSDETFQKTYESIRDRIRSIIGGKECEDDLLKDVETLESMIVVKEEIKETLESMIDVKEEIIYREDCIDFRESYELEKADDFDDPHATETKQDEKILKELDENNQCVDEDDDDLDLESETCDFHSDKSSTANEKFVCDTCGAHFITLGSLKIHIKHIHSKSKSSGKNLTKEIKETIPKQKKQIKCPKCPRVYSNARSLSNHIPIHSDRHKCPVCKNRFSNSSKLDKHNCEATLKRRGKIKVLRKKDFINPQSNKLKSQLFQCPECPKLYSSFQSLRGHMHVHKGGHKCPKCENCFRCPSEMARHNCEATLKKRSETAVTTGVAVAECPKCGMRFGTDKAFIRHKVSHTNKFKCGSCHMRFSTDPNHKEKSEDCIKARRIREARIKRSRLLYSAPGKGNCGINPSDKNTAVIEEKKAIQREKNRIRMAKKRAEKKAAENSEAEAELTRIEQQS